VPAATYYLHLHDLAAARKVRVAIGATGRTPDGEIYVVVSKAVWEVVMKDNPTRLPLDEWKRYMGHSKSEAIAKGSTRIAFGSVGRTPLNTKSIAVPLNLWKDRVDPALFDLPNVHYEEWRAMEATLGRA
jgi:hypothetical protein